MSGPHHTPRTLHPDDPWPGHQAQTFDHPGEDVRKLVFAPFTISKVWTSPFSRIQFYPFSRICGQAKVMLNLHTMESELSKRAISPKSHIRGAGKKKIYLLDADADTSTAEANWISDFGAWPAADVWVKAMEEESILHPGMSLVKALVGYQSGEVSIKINESVKWKNVGCSCLKSNIWNEFLGTTNLEKFAQSYHPFGNFHN